MGGSQLLAHLSVPIADVLCFSLHECFHLAALLFLKFPYDVIVLLFLEGFNARGKAAAKCKEILFCLLLLIMLLLLPRSSSYFSYFSRALDPSLVLLDLLELGLCTLRSVLKQRTILVPFQRKGESACLGASIFGDFHI